MARPTARVLALLELLQAGGQHTVAALAERLGVDERTLRRYAAHLVDLGIPIDVTRGRYGGYRLAPGFKLPPLMFTDDEAVAVMLGLSAAPSSPAAGLGRGQGTPGTAEAAGRSHRRAGVHYGHNRTGTPGRRAGDRGAARPRRRRPAPAVGDPRLHRLARTGEHPRPRPVRPGPPLRPVVRDRLGPPEPRDPHVPPRPGALGRGPGGDVHAAGRVRPGRARAGRAGRRPVHARRLGRPAHRRGQRPAPDPGLAGRGRARLPAACGSPSGSSGWPARPRCWPASAGPSGSRSRRSCGTRSGRWRTACSRRPRMPHSSVPMLGVHRGTARRQGRHRDRR